MSLKDESGGDGKPATLSEEQLEKLAKNLAEKDWTKLAPKLGQGKTELDSYTKEESEDRYVCAALWPCHFEIFISAFDLSL